VRSESIAALRTTADSLRKFVDSLEHSSANSLLNRQGPQPLMNGLVFQRDARRGSAGRTDVGQGWLRRSLRLPFRCFWFCCFRYCPVAGIAHRRGPVARASGCSAEAQIYPQRPESGAQSLPPRHSHHASAAWRSQRRDLDFVSTHRPILTEKGLATWYTAPYKGRKAATAGLLRPRPDGSPPYPAMGSLIVVTNVETANPAPCASPIAALCRRQDYRSHHRFGQGYGVYRGACRGPHRRLPDPKPIATAAAGACRSAPSNPSAPP